MGGTRNGSAIVGGSLLAILAVASCHDATAPAPLRGRFVLESISGEPLPVELFTGSGVLYVADTIVFAASVRRGRNPRLEHRITLQDPSGVTRQISSMEYTLSGSVVSFPPPPCPINALCAAMPTGSLEGDQLIITFGLNHRFQLFRRID